MIEQTINRFWAKVERKGPDDCWMWVGAIHLPNKCGQRYGQFGLSENGKKTNFRAHRLAWMLCNGQIPDGYVVMHSCDVPLCCNPAHLKAATQAENLADRDRKGNTARGSKQGASKLTEAQVSEIKQSNESGSALGRKYGVHATTILKIKHGVNWTHVN